MGKYLIIKNANFTNSAVCTVNVINTGDKIKIADSLTFDNTFLCGASGSRNSEIQTPCYNNFQNGYRMYNMIQIPNGIQSVRITYSETNLYPSHVMCFGEEPNENWRTNINNIDTVNAYIGMSDYGNYNDYSLNASNANKTLNLLPGTKYISFIGKTDELNAGTNIKIYGYYDSNLNDSSWTILLTSPTLDSGYSDDFGKIRAGSDAQTLWGCTIDIPNGASQIKIYNSNGYVPSYVHFYNAAPLSESTFVNAEQLGTNI